MSIINKTSALEKICKKLSQKDFVTVDTEFLRDKTYYSRLCLIQICAENEEPCAIDPLADGINLTPLFSLMQNEKVMKVFHAARQDLEIFYNLTRKLPTPLFDTQVAAMVCGYGDQVGYHNLVKGVCDISIDKGAQFTDWSRRPLSERQLSYALDDVTYLRDVYKSLSAELEKKGRKSWVLEEMRSLTDPKLYENDPEEAWQRIKFKTNKPKVRAILKHLAAWREREAQRLDIPRPRVLRDEIIADIANHPPKDINALQKIRNIPPDIARSRKSKDVLAAIQAGLNDKSPPETDTKKRFPSEDAAALEMLKMLLRIQASENDVAPRLIATASDLELLAQDDSADIPALKGWRYEIFGRDALAMKNGEIALALKNGNITKIER